MYSASLLVACTAGVGEGGGGGIKEGGGGGENPHIPKEQRSKIVHWFQYFTPVTRSIATNSP